MTSRRRHFSFRARLRSLPFPVEYPQLAPGLHYHAASDGVLVLGLEAGMAEIKVEPKRSGFGWLLAIIILALVAAGVWYFMTSSRAAPAINAPADSTRTSLVIPAVAEGATNG